MDNFLKKSWMYIALIFGLGFGFLAIRSSMDAGTSKDIAGAMSSIPFADGIYGFLRAFIPMDPGMFPIEDKHFFLVSLLILLIQAAIQAPIMLFINNAFGPILFRTGRAYSIAADPSATRSKNKLINKLLRLLALVIIIPMIAFFSSWLFSSAIGWINGRNIILRTVIYVVIVACLVGIVLIPMRFAGARKVYWAAGAYIVQSVVYVFITNVLIIAVVGILVSGISGWHFMFALLALAAWMVVYSDTDTFLIRRRVSGMPMTQ